LAYQPRRPLLLVSNDLLAHLVPVAFHHTLRPRPAPTTTTP
jgi:hypothetical protein